MIESIAERIKCLFSWHSWDKYQGFYEEKPHPDAICLRCGRGYEQL